jgi:hypothetical protein
LSKLMKFFAGLVLTVGIIGIFGLLVMPKQVVQAEDVTVTATVTEAMDFTISAVGATENVNGATTNVATSTGTAVPFGDISISANRIAAHDLTVTTNAVGGYTVTIQYTGALTKGSDTIDNISHSNASPGAFTSAGTEGFGYTTNDATLGTGTASRFTSDDGDKWAAFTTSPLEVAYNDGPVASQVTRVGYQLSVAPTTANGAYSTTVTYTATPSY